MIVTVNKRFLLFLFLVNFLSCKRDDLVYEAPNRVAIASDTIRKNLSDFILYDRTLKIKSTPYKIEQVNNFISTEDYYIIFDSHRATQEKIYLIDKTSGEFKREILVPRYPNGDLSGIRDICYDSTTKKLFALGFRRIFEFDLDGNLTNLLPIEMDGNRILVVDNGHLLLESSPNEEDEAKYHHLVLLDKHGKIRDRFLKYTPNGKSFLIREFGFLRKTENGILYNKPFGDTVYKFSGGEIRPLLTLDFGNKRIKPNEALNFDNILGGAFINRACLKSDIEVMGNTAIFSYQNFERKQTLGFYDIAANEFANSRNTSDSNEINNIMLYSKILGQDNGQLIFELSPLHADGLLEDTKKMMQLKKKHPQLFETIQHVSSTQRVGLLFFRLSKNNKP